MWEYVRAIRAIHPQWFVWENVPGALSSSHGEDFRCLLESMDDLGYGLAWRVLDAQFFGVAQRRRRVFLVGHLGDQRAAEVLFEPESLRWDTPSSREKREALTRRAASGVGTAGFNYNAGSNARTLAISEELSPTLKTDHNPAVYQIAGNIIGRKPENGGHQIGVRDPDDDGAYTLTATDRHAVAFVQNQRDEVRDLHDCAGSLAAQTTGVQQTLFPGNGTVRRLTPLECERLHGFADGYTDIPYKGKPHAPDSARYKALGNSMAVPVMRWIGRRIKEMES